MKHISGILLIIIGLIAGLAPTVSGQNTSNKGTDFWLAYGNHVAGYIPIIGQDMVVYITSDVSTSGIMDVGGTSIPFQVTANAITNVTVPQSAYIGNVESKISNKGIHITSQLPIVVYAHIYDQSVSGATLVLPTNTLGKDYFSLNYEQISNSPNSHSFFFVVATEDNTEIIITPSVNTQGGLKAGVASLPIKLNKGEIYQVFGIETSRIGNTTKGSDLTGTRIQSVSTTSAPCKKIAVFSGSGKIAIGCLNAAGLAGSSDNLFQQAYPTASWGKTFITVPSKDRSFDVYRIFKSEPNAVVKLNGAIIPSTSFINGFYYQFEGQTVNSIESDKAIQVVLYAVTQGKSMTCQNVLGDVGDPEMIFLNPLEQTLSQITMYSTPLHMITKHFINIVIPKTAASSFTLDGTSQASLFQTVSANPEYSYAQIPVSSGTHNLQANAGFNAIAYGFGNAESYGYAAGANVKGLGVEIRKSNNNKLVNTVCVNEPLNLSVKLNSLTNKIVWDLGNGSAPTEFLNPVPVNSTPADGLFEYVYPIKVIYNALQDYKIKVTTDKTSTDGCGSTEVIELQFSAISPPGAVMAALKSTCVNVPTAFRDTSSSNGKKIVKWLWDFGDGKFSDVQHPVHTFIKGGVYSVKLLVEGETGCESDVISQDIIVYNLPVSNFTAGSPACENKTLTFSDQSVSSQGKIIKWTWDFGDQSVIEEKDSAAPFTHTFKLSGTYLVKLKVLTENGCESVVFEKSILINPLPLVDFQMPSFCLSDATATFTNKTTIAGGAPLTYLWNFGDKNANAQRPNISTSANPSHVYTAIGFYTVTLTVTSDKGCESFISKQFTVNGTKPKADFTIQNSGSLCSNQPVQFKDISITDFGEITKIEWYFDTNNPSVLKETDDSPALRNADSKIYTHAYPAFSTPLSKTITVKMLAYSGQTCVGEKIKTLELHAVPQVDFETPAVCLTDGLANFNDISTIVGAPASFTYLWDFGDQNANEQRPNTSTAKAPAHAYTVAGNYSVSLTVTSANGCSVTRIKSITISGSIPKPNFNILNSNALCSNKPVVFQNISTLAFGEITSIEWYFDNDNAPTNKIVDLKPISNKEYSFNYPVFSSPLTKQIRVRMVTYSGTSCVDEKIQTITLIAAPSVSFTSLANVCQELAPFRITQASELSGLTGIGTYSGPGVSSTGLFNPSLAGVGTHTLQFAFSASNGCSELISQTITVMPTPLLNAGRDTIILEGGEIKLNALASGSNLTYKWFPLRGLSRDDIPDPVASPVDDVTYTLTVTSDQSCVSMDNIFIKVLKQPEVPNAFSPNNDGVNDLWNVKYLESYANATVKVFSRYGGVVYQSNKGYSNPWSGQFNGIDLPAGTYYYIIDPKTKGRKVISGAVTILR